MGLRNVILVAGAVLVAATDSLAAQRAAPPLPRFVSTFGVGPTPIAPHRVAMTFGHPADYRWEGFLAGGVALGAVAMYWSGGNPLAFVFGAVAGGVPGGLIGALVPKAPADST